MCNKKACYAFNDNHAPENWDLWSLTEGDMQQNGYWRQLKLPKRRAWCCSIHCFIKTKHQMKARSQVDDRRAYIRCCKLRHSHLHIKSSNATARWSSFVSILPALQIIWLFYDQFKWNFLCSRILSHNLNVIVHLMLKFNDST